MMQLGDVIARFDDNAFVGETLLALDDLALTARIAAVAAEHGVPVGEFAAQAVGQFVNSASDEEWLTVVGSISCADNPGEVFLRRVLSTAVLRSQGCGCG